MKKILTAKTRAYMGVKADSELEVLESSFAIIKIKNKQVMDRLAPSGNEIEMGSIFGAAMDFARSVSQLVQEGLLSEADRDLFKKYAFMVLQPDF